MRIQKWQNGHLIQQRLKALKICQRTKKKRWDRFANLIQNRDTGTDIDSKYVTKQCGKDYKCAEVKIVNLTNDEKSKGIVGLFQIELAKRNLARFYINRKTHTVIVLQVGGWMLNRSRTRGYAHQLTPAEQRIWGCFQDNITDQRYASAS